MQFVVMARDGTDADAVRGGTRCGRPISTGSSNSWTRATS